MVKIKIVFQLYESNSACYHALLDFYFCHSKNISFKQNILESFLNKNELHVFCAPHIKKCQSQW